MFETTALIKHFTYVGISLILASSEVGFPFPEDAILLLSGFFAAHGIIEPIPAFLSPLFQSLGDRSSSLFNWEEIRPKDR
jgi:membrane protein DedA with SNARE-associated domain